MSGVRTRFAPSPTGDLHLGGAFTALASWTLARQAEGSFVMRVEDLDRPRIITGAEERQLEDLRWLGITWDEGPENGGLLGPYRQTERDEHYNAALADLTDQARTYLCDCSRAEIARVASAPHAGEEVPYPGTCRDKSPLRSFRRSPAARLRVEPSDTVEWHDEVAANVPSEPVRAMGDFVLRRGDGVYAYQLAVSADDLAMGITDVVRGADLLSSTPRQLLLMQLWRDHGVLPWAQARLPRYWHLPLVTGPDGDRLAKRTHGTAVRELREAGIAPETVVGQLAHALGLRPSAAPATAHDVVRGMTGPPVFRRDAWAIPADWAKTSEECL